MTTKTTKPKSKSKIKINGITYPGNLTRLPSGSYRYRWSTGGHVVSFTEPTRQAIEARIAHEASPGGAAVDARPEVMIATQARRWIDYQKRKILPASAEQQRRDYNNHIHNRLKMYSCAELDRDPSITVDLHAAIFGEPSAATGEALSPGTAKNICGVVSSLYAFCLLDGRMTTNHMRDIMAQGKGGEGGWAASNITEAAPLEPADVMLTAWLLRTNPNRGHGNARPAARETPAVVLREQDYARFVLAATTGIRMPSEIHALTWADIYADSERPSLIVNKRLSGGKIRPGTKTSKRTSKGSRRMHLPKLAVETLHDYKALLEEHDLLRSDGLLFFSNGDVRNPVGSSTHGTVITRHVRPLLERALTELRDDDWVKDPDIPVGQLLTGKPYSLRSTAVTAYLMDPNWTVAQVAVQMGHSIEMMDRAYTNIPERWTNKPTLTIDEQFEQGADVARALLQRIGLGTCPLESPPSYEGLLDHG